MAKRVKIQIEFLFKASPTILYQFFTTPSCLVRWFCDDVDVSGEVYSFSWDGSEEVAEMIDDIEDERVRFVWHEAESEEEYLEFLMERSDMTGETILTITDFCDADEAEDQKRFWETQMKRLHQETGG